jgi:hypothetical protein
VTTKLRVAESKRRSIPTLSGQSAENGATMPVCEVT